MRKLISFLMALVLLCGLVQAAGAETAYVDVRNDAEGFTTKMPEGKIATISDAGQLDIWLEAEGYVPNLWIHRRTDKVDPAELLYQDYPAYLQDHLGDRLLQVSELGQTAEIGGKTLPGIAFIYEDIHGNKLYRINLMEVRDDGDVEYQARFSAEDRDMALEALDAAVRYYQPDPVTAPTGNTAAIETTQYDDGKRFSMMIPKGWQVLSWEEYSNFCFKAWDPSDPDRCFFMFMKMEPILKSYAAKAIFQELSDSVGYYGNIYEFFAKASVLEVPDLEHYLKIASEGKAYCQYFWKTGMVYNPDVHPEIFNAQVIRNTNGIAAFKATNSAGRKIEGTATVDSIVSAGIPNWVNGVDCSAYTAYGYKGYTVPEGEMETWGTTLADCLCSFSFKEQYVKDAIDVSENDKNMMLEVGRQLQQMHDALVQAWSIY